MHSQSGRAGLRPSTRGVQGLIQMGRLVLRDSLSHMQGILVFCCCCSSYCSFVYFVLLIIKRKRIFLDFPHSHIFRNHLQENWFMSWKQNQTKNLRESVSPGPFGGYLFRYSLTRRREVGQLNAVERTQLNLELENVRSLGLCEWTRSLCLFLSLSFILTRIRWVQGSVALSPKVFFDSLI